MHTIERYHDISCGHRVCGHESKCAHLHGHNYRVTFVCAAVVPMIDVTTLTSENQQYVAGETQLDDIGRVIDFSVVKAQLCQWLEDNWDHKFLAHTNDPVMRAMYNARVTADAANVFFGSLVWLPFNPTAENMAQHLVEVVGPQQLAGTGVQVIACKVEETRKCSATYFKGD